MKETTSCIVYVIENTKNGKLYIGITSRTVEERFKAHLKCVKYNSSQLLHRAMRKHGVESFVIRPVIEGLSWKEACLLERQLIQNWGTYIKQGGYNLTLGGDGTLGYKHTEEAREKIRYAFSGDASPNKGRKASVETRLKQSLAKQGKKNVLFGKKRNFSTVCKIAKANRQVTEAVITNFRILQSLGATSKDIACWFGLSICTISLYAPKTVLELSAAQINNAKFLAMFGAKAYEIASWFDVPVHKVHKHSCTSFEVRKKSII